MSTIDQRCRGRHRQAHAVRFPGRGRGGRHPQHGARRARRQARAVPGAGGHGWPDPGRARRAHRYLGALRPRVAQQPGGRRLRRLRPGQRALLAAARADGRADRQRQPRLPARLLPDRARLGDRLAAHRRGGDARQRRRLARAHARCARGLRAVLPARLQRPPAHRVAAGARRRRREARAGCDAWPTWAAATAPPRC